MINPTHPEDIVRKKVFERLKRAGVYPNENLGQHFLIDDAAIGVLTSSVTPGNTVIEVGAGVGQLTESLASVAGKIIAIEIDRRYKEILDQVTTGHSNVEVIYGDAIALKWPDFFPKRKDLSGVQIVSNLPYHISEPFLHVIMGLPLESATLIVGQRLARSMQVQSEEHPDFGKLSLLAQTFFDIDLVAQINKDKFFPVPRTDSTIIILIPKEETKLRVDKRAFILQKLFLTTRRNPLVKNSIKEGLVEFSQLTQNQARLIIENMSIPREILDKPFEQLNNNELRVLSKVLRN